MYVLSSLKSVFKSSSLTSVSNLSKSKLASSCLHKNVRGDSLNLLYDAKYISFCNKENCNKLNEMMHNLLTFLAAKCSMPREI